ncbi:MAG TPA: hypothetical protein VF342_08965 [Alphaproteobacteria bacterium]
MASTAFISGVETCAKQFEHGVESFIADSFRHIVWREILGQERKHRADVAGRVLGAKRRDDLVPMLAEIVCEHRHGRIGQTRAGETRRLRRRRLAWRRRRRRAGRAIRGGTGRPVGGVRNRHDVRRRAGHVLASFVAHDGFPGMARGEAPANQNARRSRKTVRAHLSGPNSIKSRGRVNPLSATGVRFPATR